MTTHSSEVTGTLDTPLGRCGYTWHRRDSACLWFRDQEPLMLRGIPYGVTFHVKRAGATWERESYQSPWLNRKDSWDKAASSAARKKVHDDLLAAWQQFADCNPELARDAERHSLECQIKDRQDKIADLRKGIDDFEKEIKALIQRHGAV